MEKWEKIIEDYAEKMIEDSAKRKGFCQSPAAKIVAATPFVAGCRQPERTAIAHLATLQAASQLRNYADHTADDDKDPLERLAVLRNFEGGNKKILEKSENVLAYLMIKGYEKDKDKDKTAGKYNPLQSGRWDDKTLQKVEKLMAKTKEPTLDKVVKEAGTATVMAQWWLV